MEWKAKKKEENKATFDGIQQLKLEVKQEELKARIATAKKKQKDNKTGRFDFHIPGKIFTDSDSSEYNSFKNKLSKKKDERDYSKLL